MQLIGSSNQTPRLASALPLGSTPALPLHSSIHHHHRPLHHRVILWTVTTPGTPRRDARANRMHLYGMVTIHCHTSLLIRDE